VKSIRALDQELAEALGQIGKAADCFGEQATVSALCGDGSERRFFRVRQGTYHAIVLISPRQKSDGIDENDSYFLIGNHLYRHNVPVPRIHWADLALGRFVLEDLGDLHLQTYLNRRRVELSSAYRHAVFLLVDTQQRAREGFEKSYCFDSAVYDSAFVYQRELEYFRERFLNGCLGLGVGPDDLRQDFENIAEAAGDCSCKHVIHRDFQSRNLMVCKHRLRLVDFQGMRFGPAAYDLASLLIDPYVRLSPEIEMKAVRLYWSKACGYLDRSFGRFLESYAVLRLCRNLQVLGAYSYLGLVKGKRHFLRYLPRAWKQLSFWINEHRQTSYPALRRLVNGLEREGRLSIRKNAFREVFRDREGARCYRAHHHWQKAQSVIGEKHHGFEHTKD
jgi:N-acetylmuramate 1-kinase